MNIPIVWSWTNELYSVYKIDEGRSTKHAKTDRQTPNKMKKMMDIVIPWLRKEEESVN